MSKEELRFERRPSVLAYMLRGLYPSILRRPPPFPPLRALWRAARPDTARVAAFLELTGLRAEPVLPLLCPLVLTFPLQMVLLTHPSLPFPIWKVLQIRNRILQHLQIPSDAALDAQARVAGERVLPRGLELDLHVEVRVGAALAWEALTTYSYRGHLGPPTPAAEQEVAPAATGSEVARWLTGRGGGLRFSGLSGDTNGIHYWDAYARLLGLRGAIHHPHALVGQCLARLPEPGSASQRLDLWLKGPVYYGRQVSLSSRREGIGVIFALSEEGMTRPALVGRWCGAPSGSRLTGPRTPMDGCEE